MTLGTRFTYIQFAFLALFSGCSDSKPGAAVGGASSSGGSSSSTGGSSGGGSSSNSGGAKASGGVSSSTGGAVGGAGTGGMLDPSVLSERAVAIDELKLDASRVYWLEGHNRILSLPLAGGTPSVVYASTTPGAYEALHIALGAKNLYFTDQGARQPAKPRGVFSVPLEGGERTQLITTMTVDNISADGEELYFTAEGCIARMPGSGGAARALVRNINTDTPLVIHGGYVYFWYAPDATVKQNIYRVSVDANAGPLEDSGSGGAGGTGAGGASGASSAGSAGASDIVAEKLSDTTRYSELILAPQVDGGYVYWSIYDELYRWPIAGGMQEKFGVLSKGSISLLLVDHGDIYWGGGSLQQFVIGGDSNTNVVTGLQGISAVAVNSTDIFVADGKLLRRVARP